MHARVAWALVAMTVACAAADTAVIAAFNPLHAPMLLPHPRQHGVAGSDAGERISMPEEIPQLLDQRLQAPVEAADAFGERLIFRGLDRPV